jgi:NADH dehydrogenase (ubiquinone) 1 alpha subcomplex subunit 4
MKALVVWTKSNPTPWNTIQHDQGTKLVEVNQKFDKRYAITHPKIT